MIRPIIHFPDPKLRTKCVPVEKADDVREVIVDLLDTMYASKTGCGLAAPQIGFALQVCVVDAGSTAGARSNPLVFINPSLDPAATLGHSRVLGDEGCLSLPGAYVAVRRFTAITVKHLTAAGWVVSGHQGFEARVIQHEVDHLRGKLMIDDVSKGDRRRAIGQINAHVAELRQRSV